MKVTLRQISIDSKPESTFFLKLEWSRNLGAGFVVVLCDCISAWSGEVSEEDVTREAQEMEMQREKYVDELQLALTGDSQTAQSYTFCLTPEKASGAVLQLSYEKRENNISFRLGMVELLPVPESTGVIRELINYSLERGACLKAKNHHLLEENQRIRNELEHITGEMEKYVRRKETLEFDLYSRFLLVLNEKKTKLCALQERIEQLQVNVEEKKDRRNKGVGGNQKNDPTGETLDEDNEYGSTTDEDQEVEDPKTAHLKTSILEVLPSNPLNDSLHDITDVAPSRKRRQRHFDHLPTQTKKPTLEQRQSSRNERPKEDKAEVKGYLQQPAQVSPDPDDLFDDI